MLKTNPRVLGEWMLVLHMPNLGAMPTPRRIDTLLSPRLSEAYANSLPMVNPLMSRVPVAELAAVDRMSFIVLIR